jgi:hypothetical protein
MSAKDVPLVWGAVAAANWASPARTFGGSPKRTSQFFATEITVHSSLITIHALAFSSVSFVVKSDSATAFHG